MLTTKKQQLVYVLSDYVALNLGWLIFSVARYFALPEVETEGYSLTSHLFSMQVVLGQIIFPFFILGMYAISGCYQNVFFRSRIDEAVNTATISAIGAIAIYFIAMINDDLHERLKSYELIVLLWGLLAIPVWAERLIITTRISRKIRNGRISFNTLIIGATRSAVTLAHKINKSGRGGFNIIGYVETRRETVCDKTDFELPVYAIDELEDLCHRLNVQRLILLPHPSGIKSTGELINALFPLGLSIYITPDLYSLIAMRPRMDDIAGEPLIDITRTKTRVSTLNLKRLGDITASALTLVLLAPVYLALAIAVKADSKGPVFYRQERIGYQKRPFKIIKFRSMVTDAEADGPALSTVEDPRITRLGAFMRKYRLDEIPQFWNVLIGDMSLVGPRPEREFYINQIIRRAPYYNLLHQVRPGITSWGMVKYGYASNVDQMIERLHYDLLYIENISLGVDIKIIFHTVHTVLTGKGL